MNWSDLVILACLILLGTAGYRYLSRMPTQGTGPPAKRAGARRANGFSDEDVESELRRVSGEGTSAYARRVAAQSKASRQQHSPQVRNVRPPPPVDIPAPRPARELRPDIEVEELGEEGGLDLARVIERELITDPRRVDLYLKLLDMYHANARAKDFRRVAEAFARHARGEQWAEVARRGRELMPDVALFHTNRTNAPSSADGRRHYEGPDAAGFEGKLVDLRRQYSRLRHDVSFLYALSESLATDVGRPTPLYHAAALSAKLGGAQIYFKREDLRPAGSERMVNAIGQALVARFAGKRRLVCGSFSGSVATAFAAAAKAMGLKSTLYVAAAVDAARQRELVDYAARQGSELILVEGAGFGAADPRRMALTDWLRAEDDTFYVSGLKAGPDPYPGMAQDFQAVIGHEVVRQLIKRTQSAEPAALVSSAANGFAALGFVQPYLDRNDVRIDLVNADPGAGILPRRELHSLGANRPVGTVDVSAAERDAASQLCHEQEHLFIKPHNAEALAHAIRLARTSRPRESIVVLMGAAA